MKRDQQHDIKKLMNVVNTLHTTPLPSLSKETRKKIEAIPGSKSKAPLIMFASFGSAFAVFLVLVVSAQFALPGSPLYGLKRGTEAIRALIQPTYKENLVEVRKNELETLEKDQAPQALIEDAATEYEKASGKTPSSHPQPETPNERRQERDSSRNERRDDRRNRYEDSRNERRDSSSEENNWSWR